MGRFLVVFTGSWIAFEDFLLVIKSHPSGQDKNASRYSGINYDDSLTLFLGIPKP
jgi:hypothetical protein